MTMHSNDDAVTNLGCYGSQAAIASEGCPNLGSCESDL
jgi:hypothetical protein